MDSERRTLLRQGSLLLDGMDLCREEEDDSRDKCFISDASQRIASKAIGGETLRE